MSRKDAPCTEALYELVKWQGGDVLYREKASGELDMAEAI